MLFLCIILGLLVNERLKFVVDTLATVAILSAVSAGHSLKVLLVEVFL